MLKFLIILAYYNRPEVVKWALESLVALQYDNFEVIIIDDGSPNPILPIIQRYDRLIWKLSVVPDTPEDKLKQGGSRHGEYMNLAIICESDADIVFTLCDDDAVLPDYLTNLDQWFRENPTKNYCYSHVRIFDPTKENPFKVEKRPHWTNLTEPIHPANRVDSSQVAFRRKCFVEDGIRFPSPQTANLDAALFTQLFDKYGPCLYTGFDGQYKGWWDGQLMRK